VAGLSYDLTRDLVSLSANRLQTPRLFDHGDWSYQLLVLAEVEVNAGSGVSSDTLLPATDLVLVRGRI
jgi:hypothetical protein